MKDANLSIKETDERGRVMNRPIVNQIESDDWDYPLKNQFYFSTRQIITINLLGFPGAGKTQLIRRTHEILRGRVFVSAVERASGSELDLEILEAAGIRVYRLQTPPGAGVLAQDLAAALLEWEIPSESIMFIENSEFPVLPADLFLGETCRALVYSVDTGDDQPFKYPWLFSSVDLIVTNKIDLLPFSGFSRERFGYILRKINPDARIFEVSCRTGVGLDNWRTKLLSYCRERPVEESK